MTEKWGIIIYKLPKFYKNKDLNDSKQKWCYNNSIGTKKWV